MKLGKSVVESIVVLNIWTLEIDRGFACNMDSNKRLSSSIPIVAALLRLDKYD
jgi:hypothetical protein